MFSSSERVTFALHGKRDFTENVSRLEYQDGKSSWIIQVSLLSSQASLSKGSRRIRVREGDVTTGIEAGAN